MFPALTLLGFAYLLCIAFLRSAIERAPEAFEDEQGFHHLRRLVSHASVRRLRRF